MSYDELLKNAPAHESPEFLDYLKEHNEVLYEDTNWVCIRNVKYGWPTAFLKGKPDLTELIKRWPDAEWLKKPKSKQTVGRFHIHIKPMSEVMESVDKQVGQAVRRLGDH